MKKKSKRIKSASARSKKRAPTKKAALTVLKVNRQPSTSSDMALREQVLKLLTGGEAHADFDSATGDWPVQLAGAKVANFPHTAWMLLEHMRIAQWDILEFSRNPKHVSPKWPQGYWPAWRRPPTKKSGRLRSPNSRKTCEPWSSCSQTAKAIYSQNFCGETDRRCCAKLYCWPTTIRIISDSW